MPHKHAHTLSLSSVVFIVCVTHIYCCILSGISVDHFGKCVLGFGWIRADHYIIQMHNRIEMTNVNDYDQ